MRLAALLRRLIVGGALLLPSAPHAADTPITIETVIVGAFSDNDRATAVAKSPVQKRREALAEVTALPTGGGLLLIYVDRIGGRDLTGIMLHEVGHLLGLQHEGRVLMAAEYNRLPPQTLRWCGEATPAR